MPHYSEIQSVISPVEKSYFFRFGIINLRLNDLEAVRGQ